MRTGIISNPMASTEAAAAAARGGIPSRLVVGREPRQSLVEAVAGGGARRLHVPVAVPHAEETQLLLHLLRLHRCKMTEGRLVNIPGERERPRGRQGHE